MAVPLPLDDDLRDLYNEDDRHQHRQLVLLMQITRNTAGPQMSKEFGEMAEQFAASTMSSVHHQAQMALLASQNAALQVIDESAKAAKASLKLKPLTTKEDSKTPEPAVA